MKDSEQTSGNSKSLVPDNKAATPAPAPAATPAPAPAQQGTFSVQLPLSAGNQYPFSANGNLGGVPIKLTGKLSAPQASAPETNYGNDLPFRGLARLEVPVTPEQYGLVKGLLSRIPFTEPGSPDATERLERQWGEYAKKHSAVIETLITTLFDSDDARRVYETLARQNIQDKRDSLEAKNYKPSASAQEVADTSRHRLAMHIAQSLHPLLQQIEALQSRGKRHDELQSRLRKINKFLLRGLKFIAPELFSQDVA